MERPDPHRDGLVAVVVHVVFVALAATPPYLFELMAALFSLSAVLAMFFYCIPQLLLRSVNISLTSALGPRGQG